ncbi:MAG: prepilin-type N-terminal cleavage/methylation domain-containing protein, partial [Candidatus Methylomirabilis sp.]|nr:prepilin-type N-terminal cleavage/methylation domain-containing protein [Deltaproteobacteria bacterium]
PGRLGVAARGREGFTLLEVMAAVAVLAIALVALLEAQARSIRASHDIQLKTQAVLLAQEKMTQMELRQSEGDLPTGEDGDRRHHLEQGEALAAPRGHA